MISGAKRMSICARSKSVEECRKSVSRLSLESVCTSGYDSAQPDSRTATPSDLHAQFDLPEPGCDDKAGTTCSSSPMGLHNYSSASDCRELHSEGSSCADRLSISLSSSIKLSLNSSTTCRNEPSLRSFKLTQKSHDTRVTGKERDSRRESSHSEGEASLVIHSLKRRSDGWAGPLVRPTDPITSRLKLGRAEAIKQQEVIESFLEEASSQLEIQQEASKAQSTCASSDYLEAERIVLLAGDRYSAYMSEAEQMVSEFGKSVATLDVREDTESIVPCSATLYLTGVRLMLSESFIRNIRSSQTTHHFLCLIKEAKSKGMTATHIASLSSATCTDATFGIEFNNRFTLPWIHHDFQLSIIVYHLAFDDSLQPLKQRFMNIINSLTFMSPARLSTYNTPCLLGSCIISPTETDSVSDRERTEPLLSKFQRIGSVAIDRGSLKRRVFGMEQQSSIVCNVQAHTQAEMDLESIVDDLPLQGYLSFFSGRQWERRWFVLTSHYLSCWLYPDQPEQPEPPLLTWNLSDCSSPPELADPNICAWQFSFVLRLKTGCVRELLLSADSEAQLNQWMTVLNVLIMCLSTWKI